MLKRGITVIMALLARAHPGARHAGLVAAVVARQHLILERTPGSAATRWCRGAPGPAHRPGDAPAVVLHPPFRPPAIEDAQVEPAVDGRLDAGGAARLERGDRVVEPHVDARDQACAPAAGRSPRGRRSGRRTPRSSSAGGSRAARTCRARRPGAPCRRTAARPGAPGLLSRRARRARSRISSVARL